MDVAVSRWLYRVALVLGGIVVAAPGGEAGFLDASWTAPTTNVDGSQLTDLVSYRVYYDTSGSPCPGSSFFSVAASTPNPAPNQTESFRLTGLSTGALYYVSVTALDSQGAESYCVTPAPSAAARLEFAVNPTGSVNFGTVDVGSFVDRTFTVQNTAGEATAGTASTSSSSFSVVSGIPFTLLGAGATAAVTVRFSPAEAVTSSANVTFAATDGGSTSRIVMGTGTGTGTGTGIDTIAPSVTITSPTTDPTYTVTDPIIVLSGTASDNVEVSQVVWDNNRTESGTATGTTSWTASEIGLRPGLNVITVTAYDTAGNIGTTALTVHMKNE